MPDGHFLSRSFNCLVSYAADTKNGCVGDYELCCLKVISVVTLKGHFHGFALVQALVLGVVHFTVSY